MKKFLLLILALTLVIGLVGCNTPVQKTEDELKKQETKYDKYANPEVIVSAKKAKELIESDEKVVVIDIRKSAEYLLGHIPKAVNIWRPDYSADEGEYEFGGMRSKSEKLVKLLGDIGIDNDTMILLYDAKGDYDGARFLWQLEIIGHKKMALIDGGINGWKASGFKTTTEKPEITKTEYKFDGKENLSKLATLEDVKAAINDPNVIILDTRSIKEATGEDLKSGAFRKGRIPSSVFIEYKNAINVGEGEDTTFKTVEELKEIYESKGVTPDKTIIAYCQSGVRSAHTTFVLSHLLGYKNVKNYDGSWIEWSYNKDLPVETGEIK
ncbi:sulfurtransferase [Paramaledivibacter caminithermalis]|jgi:thiosulfate/3-mercaptopyruvate sulfurtransferase|uniref:Sulfurtransferase n=1 Tax=Paramaledivibacter caminithermalis (strain DSM 15212 / CIP 107654 / DViRD3) TaxID=1121301 RepID=A0A1M6MXL8_PARC5|nr:sulfurtransferase [Paramaledivibacter caminithermalis]SHJ88241.1 thiosulfate/3-mercaptopyruvate sulfurtransferase [Paramaledivibacter caminithermalis DSM 15212]